MPRTRLPALIVILLVMFGSVAFVSPGFAVTYQTVLKPGDTALFSVTGPYAENVTTTEMTVVSVVGPGITVNFTDRYLDGSERVDQFYIDVMNGVRNSSIPGSSLMFAVGINLEPGDPIYTGSSSTVTQEVYTDCAGQTRDTVFASYDYNGYNIRSYWDRSTGMLCLFTLDAPTTPAPEDLRLTLVRTSLWTSVPSPTVPVQTDDGLDPMSLIFVGYAPAWWVVQNLKSWNLTPCSEPKTIDGKSYDFTLETPDTRGQSPPCWGPRFHIRIWDMAEDPVFGHWSIGAVHHEYSQCTTICRHVVDNWENAEFRVRTTFQSEPATVSISSYPLGNARYYQGVYNDGNATVIQLSQPGDYSVTFTESGLPQGTFWSITVNQETRTSTTSIITFAEPPGTYNFSTENVPGYNPTPTSGTFTVTGPRAISVRFSPTLETALLQPALTYTYVVLAGWAVVGVLAVQIRRRKRKRKLTS